MSHIAYDEMERLTIATRDQTRETYLDCSRSFSDEITPSNSFSHVVHDLRPATTIDEDTGGFMSPWPLGDGWLIG
jgi:hypothetical protein